MKLRPSWACRVLVSPARPSKTRIPRGEAASRRSATASFPTWKTTTTTRTTSTPSSSSASSSPLLSRDRRKKIETYRPRFPPPPPRTSKAEGVVEASFRGAFLTSARISVRRHKIVVHEHRWRVSRLSDVFTELSFTKVFIG